MPKLASHNTMTYLPVRQWYFKPFGWMSKCQSKDLLEQAKYTDFFEFRIRFNKKGEPVFAHGLAEYRFKDYKYLKELDSYAVANNFKPIVMVNLEWTKLKGLDEQKAMFIDFCKNLENGFPNISFCGGSVKYNWSNVYRFKCATPSFKNYTASTTGNKIDDIWPWFFTKKNNKNATKQSDTVEYIRVDYIHTAS